ncbi:MAG: lipid A deacylase LpxR family protein [Chitinophaga sp.]|uniref:lipid A-modifier LpxR family protein n=1 Tax=Chitinophaga sp. TaxID=1869181 RepID=UPI0025C5D3DE|nr:lipid A-modifier LpxR family protein [Chitinophaga sp.]MBV8252632.1 lipid A deacylase LpxR family protein [Chitinophaga sp.]
MKTIIQWCILLGLAFPAMAQEKQEYKRMFRLYEDNDFINVIHFNNDQAYTNGTRFDLFYLKDKPSRSILDIWMPKAGTEAVNTYGYSFMQVMFTPTYLTWPIPDPADYYYSGGLYLTHSLHSSNPVKKYNLQTELVMGVMGPPAMAKETQTFLHSILGYRKPAGWGYQLKTDVLINLNFIVEKEILDLGPHMQISGGAQGFLGTMLDGLGLYSNIRIGWMKPYYDGFFQQYSNGRHDHKPWQLYTTIRPSIAANFHNSFVNGGLFTSVPYPTEQADNLRPYSRNKVLPHLDIALTGTYMHWGFSLGQKTTNPIVNGLSNNETGNFSVYYSW